MDLCCIHAVPCGCLQSKLLALAVVKALSTRLKKWDFNFFYFLKLFLELLGECVLDVMVMYAMDETASKWFRICLIQSTTSFHHICLQGVQGH